MELLQVAICKRKCINYVNLTLIVGFPIRYSFTVHVICQWETKVHPIFILNLILSTAGHQHKNGK